MEAQMKISDRWHSYLLFLFFLTLSMDTIGIKLLGFTLKLSFFLSFFLLISVLIQYKLLTIPRNLVLPFALLAVSVLISTFRSVFFLRSFIYMLFGFYFVFCFFLLPLTFYSIMSKEMLLKIYLKTYYVICLYVCLEGVLGLFGYRFLFTTQKIVSCFWKAQGFTYEPSYLALYLSPYITFLNLKALLEKKIENKKEMFFANSAFIFTFSSSALFSYLCSNLIAIIWCFSVQIRKYYPHYRKNFKRSLVLVSLIMISGLIFFQKFLMMTYFKFFIGGTNHFSFITRYNGIISALGVFGKNMIFGVGIGGVGPYLYNEKNHLSSTFLLGDKSYLSCDPTNVFSEILASLGLVGFFLIVWLLCRIFLTIKKALQKMELEHKYHSVLVSLFTSLLVMLLTQEINQGLFRSYIWVHLAMVYGFSKVAIEEKMI